MRANQFTSEEKTRLDPKCWIGKKIGNPKTKVKGGVRVNNCVPAESVAESMPMETALRDKQDYHAKSKALDDLGRNKDVDQKAVQQRRRDLDKEAKQKGMAEAENKGLYYNVNKRKKAGTSRDANSPKAPTAQAWKDAAKTAQKEGVDEAEKVGNMDAGAFDDAMSRLKKLAGAGPLKTVYDPQKRVYRNVPTATQPPTQPKK